VGNAGGFRMIDNFAAGLAESDRCVSMEERPGCARRAHKKTFVEFFASPVRTFARFFCYVCGFPVCFNHCHCQRPRSRICNAVKANPS